MNASCFKKKKNLKKENPSTQEAEVGGARVLGQPELQSETLSLNK
jgi:hypothetical protein